METPFHHPDLRRLPLGEAGAGSLAHSLLDAWVRVALADGRVFVGSLKALDAERNMVLSGPVEIRPTRAGGQETKAHRGYAMIKSEHIVTVGRYEKTEEQKKKEEEEEKKKKKREEEEEEEEEKAKGKQDASQ